MLVIGCVLLLSRTTRITPKQLVHYLFNPRFGVQVDPQRTLYFLDLVNVFEGVAYSSMRAEEIVLNGCSQRQFLEYFVNPIVKRILVIDVFLQLQRTLISKPHHFIDLPILMCSSQQNHVLRILDFKRE